MGGRFQPVEQKDGLMVVGLGDGRNDPVGSEILDREVSTVSPVCVRNPSIRGYETVILRDMNGFTGRICETNLVASLDELPAWKRSIRDCFVAPKLEEHHLRARRARLQLGIRQMV